MALAQFRTDALQFINAASGAFTPTNYEATPWAWHYDVKSLRVNGYPENATKLLFNANTQNVYDVQNLMAGHANGDDIHPYSIKLLPILVY